MNTETLIENRTQVDRALQTLLFETREIVYELVKPLAAQGKFSLDNIPIDSRGKLRTVDDVAQTMDPTALLAVLSAALSNRHGPPALHIPGVNFRLVDKVRKIRNEYSHGGADYNNINYVRDAVNATNDLRLGLLNARTRPHGRQNQPSRTLYWQHAERPTRLHPAVRKVNVRRKYGDTPLLEAVLNNYAEKVNNGETPLHYAVRNNYAEKVNSLISEGADVNTKGNNDATPLHYAVRNGHAEIANALIVAGAEVNAKENNGETPLHRAARSGYLEVAQALIVAGAEVNAKDNRAYTPLHRVAERPYREVAQMLIAEGAEVNVKGNNGETPLHRAAEKGQLVVVEALIAEGAEVNVKGNNGETPRHYAVRNGHPKIANALIVAGAKVNAKDNCAYTPLHRVAERPYTLKGTQSAPSIFERIKGFYREATRPVICNYGTCARLRCEGSAFCFEHQAEAQISEAISEFLNSTDVALWKFRKRFEIVIKPLGANAGIAVSVKEMAISSHVYPDVVWRVFRHEVAHILDWTASSGSHHGGTWYRQMEKLGKVGSPIGEVFPIASKPVLPECLIKVRLGRRDRWKLKIEPLPPGWRGY